MEKSIGARLLCVAEAIPPCRTLVDCGCDHGYVSIYAAKKNKAMHITASDINRGPLDNAEREILAEGLADRIKTVLTDGLDGIAPHDCVVIAGMGGEMIADIISRAEWTKDKCTLVLQPMTRAEVLRGYLFREGFSVTDEKIVAEGRHIYCVIVAKHTGSPVCEPFERYISRAALTEPLAREYTDRIIARLRFEYEKKSASGALSEDEKEICERNISSLMNVRETL
ncbi:MAG: SAM-dependent methyltransferase [Oscillospiraceae bacterium]|nr:SAM-dependent methyltransferase [Oscillospiraceae bacterium]